MEVMTRYGVITEANSGFGYGFVTVEGGEIVYRDATEWRTWKTVAGFERWAAKQNKMCGGVFSEIETRRKQHITGSHVLSLA